MKLLNKIENIFCSVGLLSATIILFVNITLRFVFSAGFSWAEELTRYLVVMVTFMGLSIGIREGQNIRVDILIQALDETKKRKLEIIIKSVEFIFAFFLVIIAYKYAMLIKGFGQFSSALELPMYIMYLIIVVGGVLTGIRSIQELKKLTGSPKQAKKEG